MFKYGGFKLFLFKIIAGLILVVFGLFLIISIGAHDPKDPGIGKLQTFGDIRNIFGYFGALTSSLFLFLFGFYSYVLSFFFLYVGLLLFFGFLIKNIFFKFFLVFASSVFFNQILIATQLKTLDTGTFYRVFEFFVINFLNKYNLHFADSILFYYTLTLFSFFALVIILFYVFNIKFRYLKKLKLLESAISLVYKKIHPNPYIMYKK